MRLTINPILLLVTIGTARAQCGVGNAIQYRSPNGSIAVMQQCDACLVNWYCPDGITAYSCPTGSGTNGQTGSTSMAACVCQPGYYGANGACNICESGFYCTGGTARVGCAQFNTGGLTGSINASACMCEPGFYGSNNQCTLCERDFYCPGGATRVPCPNGHTDWMTGARSDTACICNAGYYGSTGLCNQCEASFFCSGGQNRVACPSGTTSSLGSASQSQCATGCAAGSFLSNGHCVPCPERFYCTGGTASSVECPHGSTAPAGSTSLSSCICRPGWYGLNGQCTQCEKDYFCSGGSNRVSCGEHSETVTVGRTSPSDCVCQSGFTKSQDGSKCVLIITPSPSPTPSPTPAPYPSPTPTPAPSPSTTTNQAPSPSPSPQPPSSVSTTTTDSSTTATKTTTAVISSTSTEGTQPTQVPNKLECKHGSIRNGDTCVCGIGFGSRDDRCLECNEQSYKPVTGNTPCLALPPNSVKTINNQFECQAGFGYDPLTKSCTACGPNSIKVSVGNTACIPCETLSSACQQCPLTDDACGKCFPDRCAVESAPMVTLIVSGVATGSVLAIGAGLIVHRVRSIRERTRKEFDAVNESDARRMPTPSVVQARRESPHLRSTNFFRDSVDRIVGLSIKLARNEATSQTALNREFEDRPSQSKLSSEENLKKLEAGLNSATIPRSSKSVDGLSRLEQVMLTPSTSLSSLSSLGRLQTVRQSSVASLLQPSVNAANQSNGSSSVPSLTDSPVTSPGVSPVLTDKRAQGRMPSGVNPLTYQLQQRALQLQPPSLGRRLGQAPREGSHGSISK